jgi:hypothetical protein
MRRKITIYINTIYMYKRNVVRGWVLVVLVLVWVVVVLVLVWVVVVVVCVRGVGEARRARSIATSE